MPRPNEQGRILEAIRNSETGITFQELQATLGLCRSCIRKHLAQLKARGTITDEEMVPPSGARNCKLWIVRG